MPKLPGQRDRRPADNGRRGASTSQAAITANTATAMPRRNTISIEGSIGAEINHRLGKSTGSLGKSAGGALPVLSAPAKHEKRRCAGELANRARPRGPNAMEYFAQQLINGVTLGSIYGLIAIGYTMVYGIIGMINFAHGDVFMVGGFIALIAFLALVAIGVTSIPIALFLVLLIAMALTALYGWTVERFAYRPLRGSFRLAPLISAIGMSIILQNYAQIVQGARVKPLQPLVTGDHTLMTSEAFNVQ